MKIYFLNYLNCPKVSHFMVHILLLNVFTIRANFIKFNSFTFSQSLERFALNFLDNSSKNSNTSKKNKNFFSISIFVMFLALPFSPFELFIQKKVSSSLYRYVNYPSKHERQLENGFRLSSICFSFRSKVNNFERVEHETKSSFSRLSDRL